MGVLEILEKYLSDYYRSDDVARMDDLCKYINSEMTEAEEKEKNLFDEDIQTVFAEFLELQDKLMARALQNLIKQKERQWINVNDDLPDESLFVSVMQDDSDFERVAFLEDGEWVCSVTKLPLPFKVTHWRHN